MSAIKQKGFTLIEMMITVLIIAILVAVALPSYNEYIRRSVRTKAQSYLADLAQREELFFQNNRRYVDVLSQDSAVGPSLYPYVMPGGVKTLIPSDVKTYYADSEADLVITCTPADCVPAAGNPASFVITIKPKTTGPVHDEGLVTIDSQGTTTWVDRHGKTKLWSEK